MIDILTYRMGKGLHCCRHFKVKGLMYLSFFELMIILSLLLLRSGDVEHNPGPEFSDYDSASSSSSSSSFPSSNTILQEHFSIVHYNKQSLLYKVNILESELRSFDVVCPSETWLDQRTTDNDIDMHGFKVPYRRDCQGDNHGGIRVYVKENIYMPNEELIRSFKT